MSLGGGGSGDGGAAQQAAEEARKSALRGQINQLFGVGGETPQNFVNEENALGTSLRGYYGDEQKKAYDLAERNLRFGAANTGNIGSTTYADAEAQLADKNRMGGTRIEEAVQRAINGLRAGRENTRLNSISLVNSGSGPDAVQSAAAGLKSSLDTAQSANRENLVNDLFTNLAFTKSASDTTSRDAKLAQLFSAKNGAYFPTASTGGRVLQG